MRRMLALDGLCASRPTRTLTLSCGDGCLQGESCVVYDAADVSPCEYADASSKSHCRAVLDGCRFQCFEPYGAVRDTFKFYVTFNATRATKQLPLANATEDAALQSLTGDVPFESNALVRRVGVLSLPPSISTVLIAGGRSDTASTKGDVVDLSIDPAILSASPQVRLVALLNIDLSGREADVAEMLPLKIVSLELTNTQLKQLPVLESRPELQILDLEQNDLNEFLAAEAQFPSLRELRLTMNSIRRYSAPLPSLEFLDLSDNKLEVFPFSALESRSLHTLRLDANPTMKKVLFSVSQFANISRLEEFSIDSDVLDNSSCQELQVQTIPLVGYNVCVLSDVDWTVFQAKSTEQQSNHGLATPTLVAVVVVAVLVAVGIAVGCHMWWKKKRRQVPTDKTTTRSGVTDSASNEVFDFAGMHDSNDGSPDVNGNVQLRSIASPTHRASLVTDPELLSHRLKSELIKDVRIIGHGGYAAVWLVRYEPLSRHFASKRLIQDLVTREKSEKFVAEIKLNTRLVHPSIVQVVGVAWIVEADLQVLMEYMPNGDLRSHLDTVDPVNLAWDFEKLRIAIDVIEALVYVHSFYPPLVRRDLKSRNVLLTEDLTAKLCDFGVSRHQSENDTMTPRIGTGNWLAPEVIAGSNSYDSSCDIYAFGVLLAELDTHRLPYDDLEDPSGNKPSQIAVLLMVARGQIQPALNDSCPEGIKQLANQCLSFEPEDRPSAIGVAYALRQLRNDWFKQRKGLGT